MRISISLVIVAADSRVVVIETTHPVGSQHLRWLSGLTKTIHGRSKIQLAVASNKRLVRRHEARKHWGTSRPVMAPNHACKLNVNCQIAQPAPSTTPAALCRDAVLTGLAGRLGQKAV